MSKYKDVPLRYILFLWKGVFMVLRRGNTGALVEALQLALYRSGFLSREPDGIFGDNTYNAVKSLQRAFNLKEDGIAGKETLNIAERYLKGYYIKTIQKGDTVWQIAISVGTSPESVITANPDIDPEKLNIGEKIIVPYGFDLVPSEIHYSYYLTSLIIDGLKARYPFAEINDISKSVEGKNLSVIKIGKGTNSLFVNAGFHANEYLNIPLVLKFAEEYLGSFSQRTLFEGLDSVQLYNNTTLHILPLVNPDGLDLVTKALTDKDYYDKAKLIAETYPFVPFPEGWKANIHGIDLNLQYPADWEKAKDIKEKQGFSSPSPIEFPGDSPLSEPESLAVYNYTLQNSFKIILAYHSQGNIIYWKYKDYLPPESLRVGNILSEASGYPLEITPEESSYAGYKDWFIKEFNRPGYTIETGVGTNPLELNQFSAIYPPNKRLIVSALSETATLN